MARCGSSPSTGSKNLNTRPTGHPIRKGAESVAKQSQRYQPREKKGTVAIMPSRTCTAIRAFGQLVMVVLSAFLWCCRKDFSGVRSHGCWPPQCRLSAAFAEVRRKTSYGGRLRLQFRNGLGTREGDDGLFANRSPVVDVDCEDDRICCHLERRHRPRERAKLRSGVLQRRSFPGRADHLSKRELALPKDGTGGVADDGVDVAHARCWNYADPSAGATPKSF